MLNRILLVTLLTIASAAIATAQTAQKNFYNEEFKAGFKYPATWKFTNKDLMPAPDEGFTGLAGLEMPNKNAFATVSASKTTEDKCKLDLGDSGGEKAKQVKMGTLTFYKSEETGGGMETVTPTEHYETFHDEICYDVTLALERSKYAKRPNDQALFNQLYVVLRTFYFGK